MTAHETIPWATGKQPQGWLQRWRYGVRYRRCPYCNSRLDTESYARYSAPLGVSYRATTLNLVCSSCGQDAAPNRMALLVCVLAIVMVLMAAVLAGVFLAIAYHNSALAYIILGAVFGFVFLAVLVMDVSFRWWPGKFDE